MSYIIANRFGSAGHIVLDRPKALNALNIEMVNDIKSHLLTWRDDPAIGRVIISSSASRAFCAGGDVREAVGLIEADPTLSAEPYFETEYSLDLMIATYPKPIISLVDGVVMGGGLGLARLSDVMITSYDIKCAMPETAIGLFPDVGASHFLRRMPIEAALMMGMTGTMIGAGDAHSWGLTDYIVAADEFEAMTEALSHLPVDATILDITTIAASYRTKAPLDKPYNALMPLMSDIFLEDTPQAVAAAAQSSGEAAAQWSQALHQKCPTSIGLFWYMMQKQPAPNSASDAIKRDFYVACKMMRRPDFQEGVRAVLIDKDNAPQWHPKSLSEISDEMLRDLFDFEGMSPLPA